MGFTRVGSNPVVGTTNHKPTVKSAVHHSEAGKLVLRSNSEGTNTGHTLKIAILKLKCLMQYESYNLSSFKSKINKLGLISLSSYPFTLGLCIGRRDLSSTYFTENKKQSINCSYLLFIFSCFSRSTTSSNGVC